MEKHGKNMEKHGVIPVPMRQNRGMLRSLISTDSRVVLNNVSSHKSCLYATSLFPAISELPFASVSKRVLVRSLSYGY